MLKTRKIVPGDRKRVFKIVENIWDGSDYIPLVFDDWVKDTRGMFIAAVDENNSLVGFEKLTMLTEKDAWIEGLRKDMVAGVRGVGRFLTEHIFSVLSKNKNIRTVRFATYFKNIESITLFSKLGFRVLEERDHKFVKLSKVKSIPKYADNTASVIYDTDSVMEYIDRSEWKRKNKSGICHSWVVKPFSRNIIEQDYIGKGNALAIKRNGEIKALCLYTVREIDDLFICFFEAETSELFRELYQETKKTAYENGQKNLAVVLSRKDKRSHELFEKFKFRSWEGEGDFLLFDLPVSMLKK